MGCCGMRCVGRSWWSIRPGEVEAAGLALQVGGASQRSAGRSRALRPRKGWLRQRWRQPAAQPNERPSRASDPPQERPDHLGEGVCRPSCSMHSRPPSCRSLMFDAFKATFLWALRPLAPLPTAGAAGPPGRGCAAHAHPAHLLAAASRPAGGLVRVGVRLVWVGVQVGGQGAARPRAPLGWPRTAVCRVWHPPPLHPWLALPALLQAKIFEKAPDGVRKCIVSPRLLPCRACTPACHLLLLCWEASRAAVPERACLAPRTRSKMCRGAGQHTQPPRGQGRAGQQPQAASAPGLAAQPRAAAAPASPRQPAAHPQPPRRKLSAHCHAWPLRLADRRPAMPCVHPRASAPPCPAAPQHRQVSTNIAETSLTVDGIIYVIDTG